MGSLCLLLIWAISTVAVVYGQSPRPVQTEQLLFNKILADYDKRVRPVLDSKQTVNVSIGIDLAMISEVNGRNEVLTSHTWLRQEWRDPRLIWDPVEYGNFSKLRIPNELIWLPDIVLYNSVEDQSRKYHKARVTVDFDGNILWGPVVRFMSSCELDITFFPFDDQICPLKLGSWTYDAYQLDVFKLKPKIDLTFYVANGEWDIKDTHVVKNVVYYPCCKEPYSDITFYIHIRRRHFYYIFNIVVPCLFLSMLTIFSFVLPPDSGEKVSLGLTVLVAYSVFMLLIADIMPPTSEYTPLISIYLIISMSMTACIVMLTILVLNLHHRGITNRRPPPLLYHLIVRHLGPMVFVSQKSAEIFIRGFGSDFPTSCRSPPLASTRVIDNKAASNDNNNKNITRSSSSSNSNNNNNMKYSNYDNKSNNSNKNIDNIKKDNNSNNDNSNNNESSVKSSSNEAANETQTIILSHLQQMSSKQHRIEEEAACTREWQLMAYVLDRLFLVCFVALLVVSTGYLLLFKPMFKRASIIQRSGS